MSTSIPAPEAIQPIAVIPMPPPQEKAPPPSPGAAILEDALNMSPDIRRELDRAAADKKLAAVYCPGEQGALIVAWGRDFGWQAAQAAMFIDCISGKPALKAVARQNLMKKAGYSWQPVRHDDTIAKFKFFHHGKVMTNADGTPMELGFTFEEAAKAGYVDKSRGKEGKQGNYDKIPKNMLLARLMANFHRWYASEVDGCTLLDPVEIMDEVINATEKNIMEKSNSKLDQLAAEIQAVRA